jgi:lipoyl(octanoyl) transferase
MDLSPFDNINPCGYEGLRVTQVIEFGITVPMEELQASLTQNLVHGLQHHLDSKLQHEP